MSSHQIHSWALLSSLTCQTKYLDRLPHELLSARGLYCQTGGAVHCLMGGVIQASPELRCGDVSHSLWSFPGVTRSFAGTTESQRQINWETANLIFFWNPGIFHQCPSLRGSSRLFHTFYNHHLPFNDHSTKQTLCPGGPGNCQGRARLPASSLCLRHLLSLRTIASSIACLLHGRHCARPFNYVVLFHWPLPYYVILLLYR